MKLFIGNDKGSSCSAFLFSAMASGIRPMGGEVAIGIEEVGIGRVRVQFDGSQKFSLRAGKVKLVMRLLHAQGGMRFSQRRIERQGFGGCHLGFREACFRRIGSHNVTDIVGIGEPDISQSEIRILGSRLLKVSNALLDGSGIPLVPVETAFQVQIIGLRVYGAHFGKINQLLRRKIALHLSRNGRSQLVLDLQQIMQLALVVLRPKMSLIADPN